MNERYVKCLCNHCDKGIEFDANGLDATGKLSIPCPHCALDTIICISQNQQREKNLDYIKSYNFSSVESIPYEVHKIDEKLETAGKIIFVLGWIGCIIFLFACCANIDNTDSTLSVCLFLAAVVSFFQGWIISLIFKGTSKVIQLLRDIETAVRKPRS
jgi:hypothetical protein